MFLGMCTELMRCVGVRVIAVLIDGWVGVSRYQREKSQKDLLDTPLYSLRAISDTWGGVFISLGAQVVVLAWAVSHPLMTTGCSGAVPGDGYIRVSTSIHRR